MMKKALVVAWVLGVVRVSGAGVAGTGGEVREVPLLTPEEEVKTFVLPEGVRAEVVAAEPMVEHPVAVAFDPRGRMWVVEMRGYMPNLAGTGELKPVGRVSVLEDTDGDGRMDKSTVFLDGLVLPRAVGFAGDGVLIGTPPKLLFCRDTDGDGKCDEQRVIATDYGVPENPENGANGLVYGLDNWIYSADWGKRIRWKGGGEFEVSPVKVMGQWGMTRDDWGRWFFNTNSDHLRGAMVPPSYWSRNPTSPLSLADVRVAKDQTVWPTNAATVNRGYREGFLRDGKLAEFTAACGPCVYRGDLLPRDWYGNVFVCEATSSMVRREVLKEEGVGLVGRNAYEGKEFLTSTYERFRPVNVVVGPEGALYVVDMHHGIIQHSMSLTEYAKGEYREKGLNKHLGTGRIFRIVPDREGEGNSAKRQASIDAVRQGTGAGDRAVETLRYAQSDGGGATGDATGKRFDLGKASTKELVGDLGHPNGWWRDVAQRLLVERKDEGAVGLLREMAEKDPSAVCRVNALWTLEGMGRLDEGLVRGAMGDGEPRVRANGVRLAKSLKGASAGVWGEVAKLGDDASLVVRVQVMLTLSGLGTEEGDGMVEKLLAERGGEAAVREAAVNGLAGREVAFLKRVCGDWEKGDAGRAAVVTDVARSVMRREDPAEVTALVELMGEAGVRDWQRGAMVAAVPGKVQDDFGLAKWIEVKEEPRAVGVLAGSADAKLRKGAERVAGLFKWPGKVMPERPKAKPLTGREKELFEVGRQVYGTLCGTCHQPDGRGQEGKAPPLAGSPWAVGPEGRLVRIVLHGLRGPVTVGERTYTMEMPGLKVLTDEQVAGVLTYVRRSWGHEASAVTPGVVQGIRDWNQARRDGWTEKELLRIR